MTRQSLRACLCAVALLGAPGLASLAAKPPDLPVNDKDTVTPPRPQAEGPGDSPSPEALTTPAGGLLLGIGASGDAGLMGGAIMGPAGDPPFVPMPQLVYPLNDVGTVPCPPANGPQPPSGLSRLEPTVRRNLASSLLFAVHPLLTLTPTDQLLDCPGDHPQPAVAGAISVEVEVSETGTGSLLFGLGVNSDAGLTGSIVLNGREFGVCCPCGRGWDALRDCWESFLKRCTGRAVEVPTEPPVGFINTIDPATFIQGLTPVEPPVEPIEKMPAEDGDLSGEAPTCPYLRQQAAGRHMQELADPDLGRDVLSNLERLLEADRLLETGRELARQGHVCEALDCFQMVEHLCPGRYDEPIADILTNIFSGVYGGAQVAEENAGEGTPDEGSRAAEQAIQKRLEQPVNVNFQDTPLKQVFDDLHNHFGLPIVIDGPALAEDGVNLDRPVSFKVEQVSLKSALNLLLHQVHLTYVIQDGAVRVTPKERNFGRQAEQEPQETCPPCPKCEKMHAERAAVKVQVRGLMKACHLAMSAGRTGRAAALAREAYALDPERVTADPLVYKMHLLTLKQDQPRSDRPARKSHLSKRSASVAPVCPALPPVDPQVPAALDRVLVEAEEQEYRSGAKADTLPYPLCEEPGGVDHPSGDCGAKDIGVSAAGLLEEFLDGLAPEMPAGSRLELGVTWGAVSLSCEVPVGGSVYHVLYNKGGLAVWTTPDPSAGEEPAEGPR
jgi:hypothetical protein